MRFTLHTVICCCVFTTVLPLAEGASGEHNTSLKKRISAWLQNRRKADLQSSLVRATEQDPDVHVGLQRDGNTKRASPPLRFDLNIRPRRSLPSGCLLVTCAYHDLLHRLQQYSEKKETTAPSFKISPNGYGRRRRRALQDVTQAAVQTGRPSSGQRLCSHQSACTGA